MEHALPPPQLVVAYSGEPSLEGGWIIQEVTFSLEALAVDGGRQTQSARYWEAWRIEPGQSTTTSHLWWDDRFMVNVKGEAARISVTTRASARFYEGIQLPRTFRPNSVLHAGPLPATTINPRLPLRGATESVKRTFEYKWP